MKPTSVTRRSALALSLAAVAACASGSIATGDLAAAPDLAEYLLGPGDRIRITIFGEERFSGEFQVGPTGVIAYPLVGEVPAGGMTLGAFVASFSDILRDGYVRDPRVSAEITGYRPIYLMGEVNAPGSYPYTPGMTVITAVATAGGFSQRAARRRVLIKHAHEAAERAYDLTTTTPVMPGDVVRILERRF